MQSPSPLARAVFLDRDGVLNQERSYVHRVEDFILFPGTGPALHRLLAANPEPVGLSPLPVAARAAESLEV